jgi:hypothetical protein
MNMLRIALTVVVTLSWIASGHAGEFGQHFEDATLRVDLYQYGDAEHESMAIDRLIRQGRWAGPLVALDDPRQVGRYAARMVDPETGETLLTTRFDSLFGEYRTTGSAGRGVVRVYHETLLLPWPKVPVRLHLGVVGPDGGEAPLLETTIDPASVEIAVEPPSAGAVVIDAHHAGDPHTCLDIAIVGDGYTADQIDRFGDDLNRFTELMLGQEPYASWREHINIRGVVVPSREEGCDEPTRGIWRTTTIGTSFNALGSPRYLLTEANRDLRDVAANVPYDTLVIMVNHKRYGGGGLYNRYCTFTAHGAFSAYLLMHEFGHSFGGLADEYYTSSTAYNDLYPPDVEPAQPNITATTDRSRLKWADLVAPDTPLPTAWDKDSFDRDDLAYQRERRELDATIARAARAGAFQIELDALTDAAERHARRRVDRVDDFMSASGQSETIGAYEGAGYASTGLYRPAIDCLMFSRGVKPLCRVCSRAVEARIRHYAGQPAPPL